MRARSVMGLGFAALLMGGAIVEPAAPAEAPDRAEAPIAVLGTRVSDREAPPSRGVATAVMRTTRGGTGTEAR